MITPETIRAIVAKETGIKDLPMALTFHDAGLSHADLIKVQMRINKVFSRTVEKIFYSDTCYTLTDRFNGK